MNLSTTHPNRIEFEGVLALLDVESDAAPEGAFGHKVVLTRKAAERSIASLKGMGVDFSADWNVHNERRKCGVISGAEIGQSELVVYGYVFGMDFPELRSYLSEMHRPSVGMSFRMTDTQVANKNSRIWVITRATFTGAAILHSDKAAYKNTRFHLKG